MDFAELALILQGMDRAEERGLDGIMRDLRNYRDNIHEECGNHSYIYNKLDLILDDIQELQEVKQDPVDMRGLALEVESEEVCSECEHVQNNRIVVEACENCGKDIISCNACTVDEDYNECHGCNAGNKFSEKLANKNRR
jgi:hypothetical protein